MVSARKPALTRASSACATARSAWLCVYLAMSSGLSMRIRGAPCLTFCDRSTSIFATRPSTRAAMSKVLD